MAYLLYEETFKLGDDGLNISLGMSMSAFLTVEATEFTVQYRGDKPPLVRHNLIMSPEDMLLMAVKLQELAAKAVAAEEESINSSGFP